MFLTRWFVFGLAFICNAPIPPNVSPRRAGDAEDLTVMGEGSSRHIAEVSAYLTSDPLSERL